MTGSSTLNKTQIYARGAHVATFDGAGLRLGLGTVSPKRQLHINGGNETVKIQITNSTTGSANDGEGSRLELQPMEMRSLSNAKVPALIFYTSNTEAMRIDELLGG